MLETIELQTPAGESLTDLTERIRAVVRDSNVAQGICAVVAPHTTAGLLVNSGMDPNTAADVVAELRRLVPTRVDFMHTYDTPADAAGHIKAALVGNSVTLIVAHGDLLLGHSQSVFFAEFDGPRSRRVLVRTIADA